MPWRNEIERSFAQRQHDNRWRQRLTLHSGQAARINVDGRTLLNFCSNDYLGLANHPAVRAAATDAIEKWGAGSGASHLVCGHLEIHQRLEERIATLAGAEAALLFSTGYMANLAMPTTFLSRHDLLLEDRLNHASLLDAGSLGPAKMKRYRHVDVDAITNCLDESDAARKLVMTDGVFSMDGDVAPVVELARACTDQDAVLVVDDAHGFGVLGDDGAGLLSREGVAVGRNVLMVGTLGKAAGSFGAFVAGDRVYVEALTQFARPYIYTTALPPAVAAASLTAIGLFESESFRRERLHKLIRQFRQRANDGGLRLADSSTAIQPLVLGDDRVALDAAMLLKENGILAIAIRPPTVPEGSSRLRFTLNAEHTDADLDRLFEVLTGDAMRQIVGVGG